MRTEVAIAIGLIAYAVLMLFFSAFLARRVSKTTDYLMGGRNFPFWEGRTFMTSQISDSSGLARCWFR